MAIYKCIMCGANLHTIEGCSIVVCDYCEVEQTVPKDNNEKKVRLFTRGDDYLFHCEFGKASGIYESIIVDFPEEAETYWKLVLCKYGIQYVDDPVTAKKIPTCNRLSYESIFDDSDYKMAIKYADAKAREVYFNNAKVIEDIRKKIIQTSVKMEPYDVFICYKEGDIDGERTEDSVIAQEVYEKLTGKGYRVFFSRITLLDIPGKAYEPYIFAALHSAKIMLAFGTDYKYFDAVWVKNEWSRFLQLMKKDEKKTFIPCFKYIDPEDFPREFRGSGYQAVDLGRVGAIQDLVLGIEKILKSDISQIPAVPTIDTLLRRIIIFWENKEWRQAKDYCEKVLDIDPENANAYLYKLLYALEVETLEELRRVAVDISDMNEYKRAVQYADAELRNRLITTEKYTRHNIAEGLLKRGESNHSIDDLLKAKRIYQQLENFEDSDKKVKVCQDYITTAMYEDAEQLLIKAAKMEDYENAKKIYVDAINKYKKIAGYKDASRKVVFCERKLKTKKKYKELMSQYETEEIHNIEDKVEEVKSKSKYASHDYGKYVVVIAGFILPIGNLCCDSGIAFIPLTLAYILAPLVCLRDGDWSQSWLGGVGSYFTLGDIMEESFIGWIICWILSFIVGGVAGSGIVWILGVCSSVLPNLITIESVAVCYLIGWMIFSYFYSVKEYFEVVKEKNMIEKEKKSLMNEVIEQYSNIEANIFREMSAIDSEFSEQVDINCLNDVIEENRKRQKELLLELSKSY